MSESNCKHCGKEFGSSDALHMHMTAKHDNESKRSISKSAIKKIKIYSIVTIILAVLFTGVYFVANKKFLPPTDMAGHIEVIPDTKISNRPLDQRIHKHILEHFDGEDGSRGGMVINYDCNNYDCEPGLIQKLQNFTNSYEYVFVAPFKNMKSKIAVTKLNRQITLDDFDQEQIEQFLKY